MKGNLYKTIYKIILFPSGIGKDKELKCSNDTFDLLQIVHLKVDFNWPKYKL